MNVKWNHLRKLYKGTATVQIRSIKMKMSVLSYLIGIGVIMIALLLLAGCQSEPVAPVEAAPSNSVTFAEADARMRPHAADRKFYSGWYIPGAGAAGEVVVPANIDPADHKFFIGADSVSGIVEPLVNFAPADRKFYGGAYVWSSTAVPDAPSPQTIDPADRKFYNAADGMPDMVHAADRKFLNQ